MLPVAILASLLVVGRVFSETPNVNAQTRVGALTLSKGENNVCSAVKDPDHDVAYFGTRTKPGIVVQVLLSYKSSYEYTLSEFHVYQTLTLNEGENILTAAVLDPHYDLAYFGTYTGKVVQVVWGAGLRRGSSLDLQVQHINCGVIDSDATKDFAYFGTSTGYYASIVKVKIGPADWPLTLVETLNLNANEGFPLSTVIDATKGFAYFGTATAPGVIVKVRLSGFTRVGASAPTYGENAFTSAIIDAAKGFAYFGTQTQPGVVVKIGLDEPLTVMMTYKPYLVTSTKPTTVTTTYTTVTQFWVGTWQLKTVPTITTYTYTSFSPSYFRRMVTSTGMTTTTVTVPGVRGPVTVVTPYTTTYVTAAVSMLPKPATMTTTFMALTSVLTGGWQTFSGKGTATYVTYVVMQQTLTSTLTISYTTSESAPPPKGPCLIASATYGSELAPEVQFLRTFRDQSVQSTFAGTNFMKVFNSFYYSFSPTVASALAESPILSQMVRVLLYPLMAALRVSSTIFDGLSFMPELAVVLAGILASTLIGAAYLTPMVAVSKIKRKTSQNKNPAVEK